VPDFLTFLALVVFVGKKESRVSETKLAPERSEAGDPSQ
jgi:hypothetical protein